MSFRATVLATIATITLAGNLHDRAYYEAKFFNVSDISSAFSLCCVS